MNPPGHPPSLHTELAAHRQALETLAMGTPLHPFLAELCLLLESLLEEGRCSILLLSEDGLRIQHGAAPSLDPSYLALIDGLPIGPSTGSCGTAMYKRTPVVVESIEEDPLWAPYKGAALPYGLRACASVPILTGHEQVLGAFAVYREKAGPYPPNDLDLLHRFSSIAALAIEGHQRTTRLREEEDRHRALVTQSLDGIFYFDADSLYLLEANPAFCTLFGYRAEDIVRLRLPDLVDHSSSSIQENIFKTMDQGSHTLGERSYRHKSGARIPVEVIATSLNLKGRKVLSVVVRDLRARKEAERTLAQREAQLQIMMDQAGDAIFIADIEGSYLDANPKALELSGYSLSELQKLHVSDLVDQEDLVKRPLRLQELREGKALLVERPLRRKDGSTFPMELSVRLMSDGRFIALGRDITARKEAEEALRLKATELQEAQALGHVGSWTLDLETNEVRWSDEMYILTGKTSGPPFTFDEGERFFDPDGIHQFRKRFHHIVSTGESDVYEQQVTLPNGTTRILRSVIRPDLKEGKVTALRGVLQDVSEIREAERAALEHQRTAESLFMMSPSAMVLTRLKDHTVITGNPAAMALFQVTLGDVKGHGTLDFFTHPEDRDRILDQLQARGTVHDYQLEMSVNGQKKVVLLSGALLTFNGEPAVLATLVDITERRQEEDAQRQRQKLESLGVLAGGIAHDFNNLLTAILGNLNLALLTLPEESSSIGYLHDMEKAALRAADLSRQMLAYSGKGRFQQAITDLNHLVGEMTQLLSVAISKTVQLKWDLAEKLPPIEGDPVQLQQVVMNLVTNASEAIGQADGFIRIHTALVHLAINDLKRLRVGYDLPPGPYLLLEVEDSGVGMSEETYDRLFDPFYTTKATGRGLGLSALLGILRGHRAGLSILSAPGQGSKFRLYFQPSSATLPSPPQTPEPTAVPIRGRILVVDDEAPIRASLRGMLELLGMQVEEASDGLEGLERLSDLDGQVDRVVLDLTMPRMGGIEALAAIRKRWPKLPVILSSGFSHQANELELTTYETFLPKPYRIKDLKEALAKVSPSD
jgi:PAS domain S-box-containing protein